MAQHGAPSDIDTEARTTVVAGLEISEARSEGAGCLVKIFGEGLGRKVDLLSGQMVVGRDSANDIVLKADAISRRHCAVSSRGADSFVRDLDSTNGTFVNDTRLVAGEEYPLAMGDLVQVGSVIFKFLSGGDVEAMYHEEIYQSSVIDSLTGLYNRRYFFEHLERELSRAKRHSRPLALILFDLDHFKDVNDEHGHLAGDRVLAELAAVVRENVRREDCCARYGGEEFAVATSESGMTAAVLFAEKLRGAIEAMDVEFDGASISVTASLGVALLTPDMAEPADLVGAADARLYEAKRAGRNRVAS